MNKLVSVRAKRAYTAIEVMMAITILASGTTAVMAMQRTAISANTDARRLDVANSMARTWVERLRRDAANWTSDATLGNARYLGNHVGAGWYVPTDYLTGNGDGVSPAFDAFGHDLASGLFASDAQFCAHVRLTWLVTNELLRAEVRVAYPRGFDNTPDPSVLANFCDPGNVGSVSGRFQTFRFVQVVTALRKTPSWQ
ncbi:MAG: prepilin-type N-terminal cleavage/methylation domain-containing protein [Myxococcales bacterium]|jgi:prepilin-type N-terminal cleavage/methylation domain-containing protein